MSRVEDRESQSVLPKVVQIFPRVGYSEKEHPIIYLEDKNIDPLVILQWLLGELTELEEEHKKVLLESEKNGSEPAYDEKWYLELADVFVFIKALLRSTYGQEHYDFSNALAKANGQFKGDFKSLKEKTGNLLEGNLLHNLEFLIEEILSLAHHFPSSIKVELIADLLRLKNNLNREARFFQLEPRMIENGKLNEELVVKKFNHVNGCLKMIRKYLKSVLPFEVTLQPWMTDYFAKEVMDWQNSERAMQEMQIKLQLWPKDIARIVAKMLKEEKLGQEIPQKQKELMLYLAGAVAVSAINENPNLDPRMSGETTEATDFFIDNLSPQPLPVSLK